ncbi:hypothetical protein [Polyangium aurulentum]|uniref:hypothetical protein n=1 Tax=Polyangium aurulentum TaxID=2567896 RepID=UPI0010AE9F55|nr:hypothetical protein [Polyangium aurulentum]UQA63041.1 hypothetical protein E8A73_022300 [Polyangium aurulentum]
MKRLAMQALGLSLSLGVTGCCCNLDLSDLFEDPDAEPSASTPGVDLGLAAYPATAPEAGATRHAWRAQQLEPSVYRVGYALASDEERSVDDAQNDLAKRVGYKSQGNGVFKWTPIPGCDKNMDCIFEDLASRSKPDLEPLIARFKTRIREAGLSSLEGAQLVVTFVQSIPYEIPQGRPFGLMPPALVVSRKKGDCDSKALLGHVLLEALGVDTVVLTSDAHRHSMLGIALPAQGTTIKHKGREYAYTEMTAKGAPIGWVGRDLLSPNDWQVVPVEVVDPKKAEKNAPATGKVEPEPEPKPVKKKR